MVLTNFYYLTNIFDLHAFDNETAAFLIFFEICTDMHIVSLFFLNKRNITTSFLMIHLKCTVVNYANLNSSSINKPFLNMLFNRPSNMLFRFFQFLIYVYFNEAFVKKFMKQLSFFNTNFQNLFEQTCNQRGNGGAGLPCPFSKIRQKCPNLEKKCPNFGYLSVKFPGKKPEIFSLLGLSFKFCS